MLDPARAPTWLDRTLYPFTSHFLRSPMGRVHYVDEGRGPAILFVHGTPTWSFLYRGLIAGLRDRYRCVAPDLLGFGLSEGPPGRGLLPSEHAASLAWLIQRLDLTDLTLAVHDFGGPIGLACAERLPGRVGRLVLFNTWMWSLGDEVRVRRVAKLLGTAVGRWLYREVDLASRVLLPAAFGDRERFTPALQQHYRAPLADRAHREACWTLARELLGSSAWYSQLWQERQPLAAMPALVLWGMRDPALPPRFLERWKEALPRAEIVRLERAGHLPQEEEPERCLQYIEQFLAAQPLQPQEEPRV